VGKGEDEDGMNPTNSDILYQELEKIHDPRKGWVLFKELPVGTGFGLINEQRLDAWAINTWPSYRPHSKIKAPYLRRAFEVKISSDDLLKELRNPDKRWIAYAISHEFYFVAPQGLIDPKLLSNGDGLMEWDGDQLKTTKKPRVREAMPPRWSFVASIARRVRRLDV
jgi:hypothetical protein